MDTSCLLGDETRHIAFCRGILVLCGKRVDQEAQGGLGDVSLAMQQARKQRDGDHYHVTFFTKADLQALAESLRDSASEAAKCLQASGVELPDPSDCVALARAVACLLDKRPSSLAWIDIGTGRARDGDDEAVFRVLLWPAGAAVRRQLGLAAQDFHITLGFSRSDVHGKRKGVTSLVAGAPDAAAVPSLLEEAELLLEIGLVNDADAETMELAEIALLGATFHEDAEGEAATLRVLCRLHGRSKRADEALSCAERLLELNPDDEVGCRSRAFSLVMLSRFSEALPVLAQAQAQLEELPATKRSLEEPRLQKALNLCRTKLGAARSR